MLDHRPIPTLEQMKARLRARIEHCDCRLKSTDKKTDEKRYYAIITELNYAKNRLAKLEAKK